MTAPSTTPMPIPALAPAVSLRVDIGPEDEISEADEVSVVDLDGEWRLHQYRRLTGRIFLELSCDIGVAGKRDSMNVSRSVEVAIIRIEKVF